MLSIRKIGTIGRTYRHLKRYRQILSIFFKYGFEDLIEKLKISQYLETGLQIVSKARHSLISKHSQAQRARMTLEELGPAYIKLGQMLSTRPDLLSPAFINEFTKLQDNVPPIPFSDVKKTIKTEFADTFDNLFLFFEKTPMASASISQVHRAKLKNGQDVAVKIQRPDIREVIETDLEIMLYLASLMERYVKEMQLHHPVKIVEEFAKNLENGLDFMVETANMERFTQLFRKDPTIHVPKVYHEMSTTRVLTMEIIDGIKVSDINRLDEAGLNKKKITQHGADLLLKQMFDYGFFHADPHPGNIFILPDNVICFIDFGEMGSINLKGRENFVDLIGSVVQRDEAGTTNAIINVTENDGDLDYSLLERDISDFMTRHLYKQLKDLEIGKLLQNLLEIIHRHRLRIPADYYLMMKALVTFEGIGLILDSDFDMIKQATPYIKKIKLARFSPKRITDDILTISSELLFFTRQFPKDLLKISHLIKEQKQSLKLELKGIDTAFSKIDQASNRLSFAIVIAALLIGSSIVIRSGTPPQFFGVSLIGIGGFLVAFVMGFWLLIAILKKGRL